jgi:AAA+ ATPase superfamily predicted ATPase
MKFYNREIEIETLRKILNRSKTSAQMTFVVGRRRIGKTSLLTNAFDTNESLYFFVSKKNEILLCEEFVEEIKKKLNVPVFGGFPSFVDVFGFLMQVSKTRNVTLIIDEFQDFSIVNSSIFSEIQHIWDREKTNSKMNLILCGSIYARMTKIFENAKEPLFGRATQRMHIKPFSISTLKQIISDYHPNYSNEDLLAFYLFTGGVAKYVELLVQSNAFTFEAILDEILGDHSLFLEEGKNVLIDEFGKDYMNYFSILSLISSGKTSRPEIESIMKIDTGGFIERLEKTYALIKKVRPILAKPNSRSIKYRIEDHFLKFWFRFIFKFKSAIEIGNYSYVKDLIRRDYATYCDDILERYFTEKLIATKQFNQIGAYWERNNQNEIDIVAINDIEKRVLFVEVKKNPLKIHLDTLKAKSTRLLPQFKDFTIEYQGLSMEDM